MVAANAEAVDLLIVNGTVLTMEPGANPIVDGAVAVRGQDIVAVGPRESVRVPAAKVLDAGGGLILPGFVNTHTHLAMVLLRGLADDLPLKEWLEQHIWPAEKAVMDAETVKLGTLWAAVESLKAGVTCVCDMYFYAPTVAEALEQVGIRGVVPESIIDFPTPSCPSPEVALEKQRELCQRYRQHPLITPAVAAHAPYSVNAKNIAKAAELAEEFDVPFLIHVAETRWEMETFQKEKGTTPVQYLADLGVLSSRTVAAHCVHVTEEDIATLAELGVGVAANPVSNLKLASGVAPLPQMLAQGVKVGFGTDGAASNNTLDLLRDAQIAALLYKGVTGDPTCMPAPTVAALLTRGGAEVLGLGKVVGTLSVGKRADVVCLATHEPHAVPVYDPESHLIYAARASDVQHVVVNGKTLVENRKVLTVDEDALRQEAWRLAPQVRGAVEAVKAKG
ncbi:MAG: 5-methylthioadenosine/S-adenosylhomocysteine deaminase [Thermoanaerobaculum sp.]|nr:MAG: 5-methylthioadenosine/S-adenosylhomocysteine deaminase [Thermoanaerobaculum sp.]